MPPMDDVYLVFFVGLFAWMIVRAIVAYVQQNPTSMLSGSV